MQPSAISIAFASLCACATPNSYGPTTSIISGFTPIKFEPPSADFCRGAATSDGLRARFAGFDATTVGRIADLSYQQCNKLLTDSFHERFERLAAL